MTLATPVGRDAEAILRHCVHCGLCNSACPTYRETSDELDGPRGRIYQMKRFLEGGSMGVENLAHLDLCLSCQACETACPSGVDYLGLLEIVRPQLARRRPRPLWRWLWRRLALAVLLRPLLLQGLLRIGRALRPLLPGGLRMRIPPNPGTSTPARSANLAASKSGRRVVLYDGCVQSAAAPDINQHCTAVLSAVGIDCELVSKFCCGGLERHLEAGERTLRRIRNNIDYLGALLDGGVEAIVSTASGCGATISDYPHLLRHDPEYAGRARRVANAHRDLAELLLQEPLDGLCAEADGTPAFHCPCTLQHALGQGNTVPQVLARLGLVLSPIAGDGNCCGSAGFYAYEQPAMAARLRAERLQALLANDPNQIFTANIGCQLHLQAGTHRRVRHWIHMVQVRG